jgi:hypothetical protein
VVSDPFGESYERGNAVTALALAGTRIGVLANGGHALVKEGGLAAGPWVDELGAVTALVLSV